MRLLRQSGGGSETCPSIDQKKERPLRPLAAGSGQASTSSGRTGVVRGHLPIPFGLSLSKAPTCSCLGACAFGPICSIAPTGASMSAIPTTSKRGWRPMLPAWFRVTRVRAFPLHLSGRNNFLRDWRRLPWKGESKDGVGRRSWRWSEAPGTKLARWREARNKGLRLAQPERLVALAAVPALAKGVFPSISACHTASASRAREV